MATMSRIIAVGQMQRLKLIIKGQERKAIEEVSIKNVKQTVLKEKSRCLIAIQ